MLARAATFTIDGIEPRAVWAEVDVRDGLPGFTLVGLGDAAVRESRERIRSAIVNSGFRFPQQRITANLAPASLRKAGPGFDAAIALALLAAMGQVPAERLTTYAVYGELSLSGELRDSPGALAVAEGARSRSMRRLIVPRSRAREASLVGGLEVIPARSLHEAVEVIRGTRSPAPLPPPAPPVPEFMPDLADVRGQEMAIFALEVAAAGGHNLLLEGPPGAGKTMLARRVPSILPRITRTEALEVTRIHSVTGVQCEGLVQARPFRAPHHSISSAGLVGGGAVPRPGEATLAHRGVLFLDELSEFSRLSLESLRQPLEDGLITIVRGQRALRFPSRFMLIGATNPCPCGYAGTGDRCRCGEADLRRHRRRLSGPLLDRIDLLVSVGQPSAGELRRPPVTTSDAARERVGAARERQLSRLAGTRARCNAELDAGLISRTLRAEEAAEQALARAYASGALTARGRMRIMRVARTIADLSGRERVSAADMLTALGLRQQVGEMQLAA